jgi:hypothetical protein
MSAWKRKADKEGRAWLEEHGYTVYDSDGMWLVHWPDGRSITGACRGSLARLAAMLASGDFLSNRAWVDEADNLSLVPPAGVQGADLN